MIQISNRDRDEIVRYIKTMNAVTRGMALDNATRNLGNRIRGIGKRLQNKRAIPVPGAETKREKINRKGYFL